MIIINKITKLLLEENNIINRNRNRNSIEESREIPVDNNIINNALDFSITEENLHIHYNFTSVRFYSENYVVNLVNKEHKGYFNLPSGGIFEIFSPKIRFAESEEDTIESIFKCQRDLSSGRKFKRIACHDGKIRRVFAQVFCKFHGVRSR